MNKSQKIKRRALTAREKLMREKYTRLVDWPASHKSVFLAVGFQVFKIEGGFRNKRDAEWMRDMLAIALNNIEL